MQGGAGQGVHMPKLPFLTKMPNPHQRELGTIRVETGKVASFPISLNSKWGGTKEPSLSVFLIFLDQWEIVFHP